MEEEALRVSLGGGVSDRRRKKTLLCLDVHCMYICVSRISVAAYAYAI